MTNSLLLKIAIEILDLPSKNGGSDSSSFCFNVDQRLTVTRAMVTNRDPHGGTGWDIYLDSIGTIVFLRIFFGEEEVIGIIAKGSGSAEFQSEIWRDLHDITIIRKLGFH